MRLLLRILLFPVTLALSVVVGVCRFVCDCSGAVLGAIATLLFTVASLTLILFKEPIGTLTTTAIAFLISPHGIPKLAGWFIDLLENLNGAMKSI